MGLGKTLQLVAFSDIFLRHTPGNKSQAYSLLGSLHNAVEMFKILISVALFDFNIQELEKILIQIII